LVTGFVAPSEAAPLAVIGVEEGDVIVSCNGQQQQLAVRLLAAIEGLQERGEPIVLVVMRDGETLTLERTEKLPGDQAGEASE
jgi:S1-C subfamily serine protease